jgi:mycothiol synthase
MYIPVDEQDVFRKKILEDKGYANIGAPGFEHYVDLDSTEPVIHVPPGFTVCSMGDRETHAARSWASWLSFHADEPLEAYDGDWSWYENVQRAPLYRRDLDIISKTTDDRIGSFCTLFYDDSSRSAVVVLDGTAKPFQRKGLGKAVLQEGLRRLKRLGCIRVFAKATDKGADAFYGTILVGRYCSETWIKEYHR